MLNQGLMEDHHQVGGISSSQMMGFYLNSTNLANYAPLFNLNHNHNHDQQHQYNDLKPFNTLPSSFALDHVTSTLTQALLSSTNPKSIEQDYSSSSFTNLPPLFSIQKPTPNYNLWSSWGEGKEFQLGGSKRSCGGENSVLGVSTLKMKKMKVRRKVREPRFCFKTMSDVDVLDDGYKWRKYGQKVVKNTLHPRSYYRCTQDNCRVKKRVERLAEDPRMVITTYEGRHIHTPSNDDDSHGGQPQLNNFFW